MKKLFSKKRICFIAVLLVLILVLTSILMNINNKDIRKVKKVLSAKYYNVTCIDSACNSIQAMKGDKLGTSKVVLINNKGKKVAKYKEKYDSKADYKNEVFEVSNKYFLSRKINNTSKKAVEYSINNRKGKKKYTTKNTLSIINENLIQMKENKNGKSVYSILNKKGAVLFDDITEITSLENSGFIGVVKNQDYYIMNKKGKIILQGYSIAEEVNIKGKTSYLILKDSMNNAFYYFSAKKGKIIGDGFQNYTKSTTNEEEIIVSKKENNSVVKYTLDKKGNQTKIGQDLTQNQIIREMNKTIDIASFYIYSVSVLNSNQRYVLVNNTKKNSFGFFDLKKKKYNELYKYSKDKENAYSTVTTLKNTGDVRYTQITCSKSNCDTSRLIVFDILTGEKLYNLESDDLIAQKYTQYDNNYKVIKYANTSTNEEYRNMYVLYDKNDKEVAKSIDQIVVVDRKIVFGDKIGTSSLLLFSSKSNKMINDERSAASRITVSEKDIYSYTKNDKTYLVNTKGKTVLSINSNGNLSYSDNEIVYIEGNTVNMLNVNNYKVKKYKLKKNEKLNDGSGLLIPMYRNAIFVNNSVSGKIKVVNSKGRILKTIKKQEISEVKSSDNGNVFIITKSSDKKNNTYGLYIAK